jgi:hypothetical protein
VRVFEREREKSALDRKKDEGREREGVGLWAGGKEGRLRETGKGRATDGRGGKEGRCV